VNSSAPKLTPAISSQDRAQRKRKPRQQSLEDAFKAPSQEYEDHEQQLSQGFGSANGSDHVDLTQEADQGGGACGVDVSSHAICCCL
jgi:hypothetical protein